MTLFDIGVAVIAGFSVLLSLIRGLVREVLALAAWVISFVSANLLAGTVTQWVPEAIPTEELRLITGFLTVFLVVLLATNVLAVIASKLIKGIGLTLEDRLLGGMFGLARGLLIVMVIVLLAGLTSLPRQPVWRDAMLSGPLVAFAGIIRTWLPAGLAQRIRYDERPAAIMGPAR